MRTVPGLVSYTLVRSAEDDGLCRDNPPVSQPGPSAHGLWPVVSAKDWCGHFTAQRGHISGVAA
ncbi:MAG: hypothetical protein WB820_13030 [Rhodoplanes sp.]